MGTLMARAAASPSPSQAAGAACAAQLITLQRSAAAAAVQAEAAQPRRQPTGRWVSGARSAGGDACSVAGLRLQGAQGIQALLQPLARAEVHLWSTGG